MSKGKWKRMPILPSPVIDPQFVPIMDSISRAIEADIGHRSVEMGKPTPKANRYKVVHKAFSQRMKDGQIIPWENEMDDFLNAFQHEHGATMLSAIPTSAYSNFVFIWEMPCP